MSFRQTGDPSHIVLTYHQQRKEVALAAVRRINKGESMFNFQILVGVFSPTPEGRCCKGGG